MDPGQAIVAIAGMLTGIITTGVIAWAIVQGLRARYRGVTLSPQVEEELAALREQVDGLQQALAETQERVDFTERLLTRGQAEREDVH
ncbi:MAG TPA: hypothetical protein PKA50_08355 [Gemmatimonadales bacterium]|nr:hypothetical protein [Gemmatimonadales bacterium]